MAADAAYASISFVNVRKVYGLTVRVQFARFIPGYPLSIFYWVTPDASFLYPLPSSPPLRILPAVVEMRCRPPPTINALFPGVCFPPAFFEKTLFLRVGFYPPFSSFERG